MLCTLTLNKDVSFFFLNVWIFDPLSETSNVLSLVSSQLRYFLRAFVHKVRGKERVGIISEFLMRQTPWARLKNSFVALFLGCISSTREFYYHPHVIMLKSKGPVSHVNTHDTPSTKRADLD